MTVQEALTQETSRLKSAGIETAALDASLLLAHTLNISRTVLIALGTDTITQEALDKYLELLERRLNGECIAYITEKKEFYGLDFLVNSSVLVPRPDTEILVSAAIEQKAAKVLDLCTGSGAIAIAIKHERPNLEVHATDISAEALDTAKANAKRLLKSESQIHFHQGSLFDALSPAVCSLPFDLILSNPPYICSHEIPALSPEVQKEPKLALDGGEDGLVIITQIIEKAPEYLQPRGKLLLEAAPSQMKKIANLLEKRGFVDIQLIKDLSGQERVIGGRA